MSTETPAVKTDTHRIFWQGDVVAGFICEEPRGAHCRSWCTTCQEECPGPGVDDQGRHHDWEPVDYCRVTTWLEAGPADDSKIEDGDEDRRDGRIETEWTGDGYVWTYADPA